MNNKDNWPRYCIFLKTDGSDHTYRVIGQTSKEKLYDQTVNHPGTAIMLLYGLIGAGFKYAGGDLRRAIDLTKEDCAYWFGLKEYPSFIE